MEDNVVILVVFRHKSAQWHMILVPMERPKEKNVDATRRVQRDLMDPRMDPRIVQVVSYDGINLIINKNIILKLILIMQLGYGVNKCRSMFKHFINKN